MSINPNLKSGLIKLKPFWQIVLACFVLGFMAAVQIKTAQDSLNVSTQYQRIEQLADMLLQTEQERDELKAELSGRKGAGAAIVPDDVNMMAGTMAVKGPGVVLTVEDSKRSISAAENTNLYIIHDEDMLKIINELKAAGAEAISINDQRLIATSEIRCAGPTVSVNNTRISAPFVIKAVGDAKNMENAVKMRGGVAESLSVWGISLSVKKESSIVVPAYKGSVQFKYAVPIDK